MPAKKSGTLKATESMKPIVKAIQQDRANWPAIYQELAKVNTQSVKDDKAFADRAPRASVTEFFRQCGQIAGMHISQMRRIMQAGTFYQQCLEHTQDLPPLDDERVAAVSPEKINEVFRMAKAANPDDLYGSVTIAQLQALLDGQAITREALRDQQKFLKNAGSKADSRALAGRAFAVQIARALEAGVWLASMPGVVDEDATWQLKAYSGLQVGLGASTRRPDMLVGETATAEVVSFHAFETRTQRPRTLECAQWMVPGCAYDWVVYEQQLPRCTFEAEKTAGMGVMTLSEEGKLVVRVLPKRQKVALRDKNAVLEAIVAADLKRRPRGASVEYAVVSL